MGRGRSARLAALAVAGVLATVVGIAISGRPEGPLPLASSDGVALLPSLSSPPSLVSGPPTTPASGAAPPPQGTLPAYRGAQLAYAVTARLAGQEYRALLSGGQAQIHGASFDVRLPRRRATGTIELHQVLLNVSHQAWTPIGEWSVVLGRAQQRQTQRVLNINVPPSTTLSTAPEIVETGFRLVVRAHRDSASAVLSVELIPSAHAAR